MHEGRQGGQSARGDAQYAAVHVGHEELPGERRARVRARGGEGAAEAAAKRVPQHRRDPRGGDDGSGGNAAAGTRLQTIRRTLCRHRVAADPS